MRLRRPALLEMLLARHIRHERNLVFQCLRYVCANGFFEPAAEQTVKEDDAVDVVEAKPTDQDADCQLADIEWDEDADDAAELLSDEEAI